MTDYDRRFFDHVSLQPNIMVKFVSLFVGLFYCLFGISGVGLSASFTTKFMAPRIGWNASNFTCDTQRVIPRTVALPDVSVSYRKPIILHSVGPKAKDYPGIRLVPGIQCASLFKPSDTTMNRVQNITIQFYKDLPSEGRVKVQLLTADTLPPFAPCTPSLLDGVEFVYTAKELADLPGQLLSIDLSSLNVLLPKNGLYVQLEGLPTKASEQYVEMTPTGTIVVEDRTAPIHQRVTSIQSYPAVYFVASITKVRSLSRNMHGNSSWRQRDFNAKTNWAENPIISVTCSPENQ